MADETIPPEVEAVIDAGLDEPKKKEKRQPMYQVIGNTKIPVSKGTGPLWKARRRQAKKATEEVAKAWEEAICYYENNHTRRNADMSDVDLESQDPTVDGLDNNNGREIENIVFANVTTMTPALYARNPQAEFTAFDDAQKDLARCCEKLVNQLAARRSGLNLKPKAKRAVVTALLCNRAWLEVGYTQKGDSSEQALTEIGSLSQKLDKAKNKKQIEEIEGQIMALEETIDVLQPAGPWIKYRNNKDVWIDPNAEEIDLSDANWVVIDDMLPTSYVQARFGKKKPGSEDYDSLYQPTHTMKMGETEEGHGEQSPDYSMFEETSGNYKDAGFDDEESYRRSQYTKVSYVWDKVTRRLLLFNTKDWTWPLWVWDDPLKLIGFFSLTPLTFFESPSGPNTMGEVSFYLDQQDAINEISGEMKQTRNWAKRNVFFDKNKGLTQADVEMVLKGPDGTARGLNVPEGMKASDLVFTLSPPSMQYKEVFDKTPYYAAIDRISAASSALRGEQFKTNTTEEAVQANVGASNMRVDEKGDAIEDFIGEVLWKVAQMCLQFMPIEQVATIIGQQAAAPWVNMKGDEIGRNFNPQVVGGSSEKPTSKAKKSEALEMGQVLGQFTNTPAGPVVLKVMLKMLEAAFDEVSISQEDWQLISNAIPVPGMDAGGAAVPPGAPGAAVQGGAAPPDAATNGSGGGGGIIEILAKLPPEIKQQMVEAIQNGADPQAVFQRATQTLQ